MSLVTSLVCRSFVDPMAVPQQGWGCVLRHLWARGAGRDGRAFHWSVCSQLMQEHSTWGNDFHISTPCQWMFSKTTQEGSTRFRDSQPSWILPSLWHEKESRSPGGEDCSKKVNCWLALLLVIYNITTFYTFRAHSILSLWENLVCGWVVLDPSLWHIHDSLGGVSQIICG